VYLARDATAGRSSFSNRLYHAVALYKPDPTCPEFSYFRVSSPRKSPVRIQHDFHALNTEAAHVHRAPTRSSMPNRAVGDDVGSRERWYGCHDVLAENECHRLSSWAGACAAGTTRAAPRSRAGVPADREGAGCVPDRSGQTPDRTVPPSLGRRLGLHRPHTQPIPR